MNKIPFINIADTGVWMLYLMPFSAEDRTNYDLVYNLQQNCIENKIFGMGWELPCFSFGTKMTDETAAEYTEKYNAQGWKVSDEAVKGYKAIRKGDYVIMRLKNSHYYVGKVSSEGAFYIHKPDDPVYGYFSWGGTVEKWVEYFNDGEVPSEIVGRFSQRLHATIQRVAAYRQRLLIMSMYENKIPEPERAFHIPKLHIGISNFVRSLNYMELEDLVALYIADKHCDEGYRLLPSSCKISQQNYEFRFVAKGKKPITCQVKNQNEIEIAHYVNETSYEKVYIFSGKWDDNYVTEINREYAGVPHLHVISPKELFDALKANNIFENDFYDFHNKTIRPAELPLEGYTKVKKIKKTTDYILSDDYACFLANDGFFYSAEFGAIVLSWHVIADEVTEAELTRKVVEDLNR